MVSKRVKKALGVVLIALAVVVVVGTAGFVAWTRLARYAAFPEAVTVAQSSSMEHGWYVFQSAETTDTALIFYPGGLVDPAAYAPLMKRVSDRGIMTVIVPMPLDLAVFGIGKANEVIAAYPAIKHWIIGGHSLGGSMAAEFVKGSPASVQGVVFLASYPADFTDLSALPLHVVSIYGTKDGLAGGKFEASMGRLPPGARVVVIDGGNHAQFGDYGPQSGDGVATITRDAQQAQTVAAIADLADALHR